MIELRPEQRKLADAAKVILRDNNIVYVAGEVRVGKTLTSMVLTHELGFKKILFVTKKKAFSSIIHDYELLDNSRVVVETKKVKDKNAKQEVIVYYKATGEYFTSFICVTFDQVDNFDLDFDLIIVDEAHSCGAFPKPTNRAKFMKNLIGSKPTVLMSGTPHPETPSQIYHQFWLTDYGPFQDYTNFYKWSKEYVNVTKRFINGYPVNDYTHAKEGEIQDAIRPYMVQLSQQEAGFVSYVEEEILRIPIDERMYQLMDILKKDKVYTMKKTGDVIVADTPVKLQSLFHQLSSGTVKTTSDPPEGKPVEKFHILDESKAWFIKTKFAGQKIAIFYKFIAEGNLLRRIFRNHTADPMEFNSREDLIFICQVVSGREGTNLSTADALVMYNIDFSATSYWQGRARMQTKDRKKASKLYWIFSEKGLEMEVYKAVNNKKSFTLQFFDRAYDIKKFFHGSGKQVAAKNYLRS